jgi:hypothetical protein
MLTTQIFDCGPLFTLLSERRWPEIEHGLAGAVERYYALDLSGIRDEQELLTRLLTAFELRTPEFGTSQDACLDNIRGALVVRPERAVLLAVFNLGELPIQSLHSFLTFVSLLTRLDRDVGHFVPSGPAHRVLLRVVFLGTGLNYPEVPEWKKSPADSEQT